MNFKLNFGLEFIALERVEVRILKLERDWEK